MSKFWNILKERVLKNRGGMGNFINFLAIILGSLIGFFVGHKFKNEMKDLIMECAGLFIIVAGLKSTINSNRDIIVLIYLIIGSIIGQIIDIDLKLKNLGLFLEKKLNFAIKNPETNDSEKSFAKGFSTATILFCTGAIAIVGAINSGLTGDDTTLKIKAILDGNISIWNRRYVFSCFSFYLPRIFLSFC